MCGSINLSRATNSCRVMFRLRLRSPSTFGAHEPFQGHKALKRLRNNLQQLICFILIQSLRFALKITSAHGRLVRKVNEGLLVHCKHPHIRSSLPSLNSTEKPEEHLGSSGFSALHNSSFLLRYAENQTLKSSMQKFGWNAEARPTQTDGSVAPLTVSGQLMQGILVCSLHRCMRKKMRKATRNHSVTTSKYWKAGQLGQPRVQNTHRKAMSREIWQKGNSF